MTLRKKAIPDAELWMVVITSWFGASISVLSRWKHSSLSGSCVSGSILICRYRKGKEIKAIGWVKGATKNLNTIPRRKESAKVYEK